MGAGQIAGMATLLGIDFGNAPGFEGVYPPNDGGQYLVYFMSHSVLFCAGALIEAHVVLTTASCVFNEKDKFDVYAGTHQFRDGFGSFRTVQNICFHKGFNDSNCSKNNLALLVLDKQFSVRRREPGTQFIINRVRYGKPPKPPRPPDQQLTTPAQKKKKCQIYGWGSRRTGMLLPLLTSVMRVEVTVLPSKYCTDPSSAGMLCIQEPPCKNDVQGALCPDDLGSVVVCGGYIRGMMVSRVINRPCGFGYIDLEQHHKFLTCGVDDAREVSASNLTYTT